MFRTPPFNQSKVGGVWVSRLRPHGHGVGELQGGKSRQEALFGLSDGWKSERKFKKAQNGAPTYLLRVSVRTVLKKPVSFYVLVCIQKSNLDSALQWNNNQTSKKGAVLSLSPG